MVKPYRSFGEMLASSLIRWIEQKTGIRNVGLRRLYNTMALAAGENRDGRSLFLLRKVLNFLPRIFFSIHYKP